ncbi:MAG: hypothetical protein J5691_05490 [Bacilli bacterium]|nr:hypothetical protein [Bacilli bacterium]
MFRVNKIRLLSLICILIIASIAIIVIKANDVDKIESEYSFSNDMIIDSSFYTGVDDTRINTNKGHLTEKDDFITTSQNGKLKLYFNKDLCIFKIENTDTGYIYSSALDEVDEGLSSEYYSGFLSSTFSIYYYQFLASSNNFDINTSRAWITKGTKHTRAEKETLSEEEASKIKLNIAEKTVYTYSQIENGVKVTITFANAKEMNTDRAFSLGITISAYVTLDNDGLHVYIPKDEIKEENEKYVLAGIMVMPLLASANNDMPGYMLIPDGAGALVRYGSVTGAAVTQQSYTFYGSDRGIQTQGLDEDNGMHDYKTLTMPVFGYVNGVNQDAMLAILENGNKQANLTVSPSGAYNIKQNFMFPTFVARFNYYLYGINLTMIDSLFNDDIKMNYRFLSGSDANYVGMARCYQEYLLEHELLTKTSSGQFKTNLDILMSDTEKSMLGYSTTQMTTLKQTKDIVSTLTNEGISLQLVLKGWNKLGYSGASPFTLKYNNKLGTKLAFKKYLASLESEGIDTYLNDNYLVGYTRGNVSKSKIATSLLKLRMTFKNSGNNLFTEYNYVSPTYANKLALDLVKKGDRKLGLEGISIDNIGNVLFSYYENNANYTRNDCFSLYDNALSSISNKYRLALSKPNDYFYKYIDAYLSMPTYANIYHLYSDNVPFVPYVIKGYIDYYGEYLNFNSLGEIGILRYLDYGVLPSFLITNEASHNLKHTDTVSYYTTSYSDWHDEIIRINKDYLDGYNATLNSTVYSRNVVEAGVVIVTYQNMDSGAYTSVIINYNLKDVNYMGKMVSPHSYEVVGGKYE